jgi:hypothetical protein
VLVLKTQVSPASTARGKNGCRALTGFLRSRYETVQHVRRAFADQFHQNYSEKADVFSGFSESRLSFSKDAARENPEQSIACLSIRRLKNRALPD